MKKIKINFVTEVFSKGTLPMLYSSIYNTYSAEKLLSSNTQINEIKAELIIVEDLPRYIKIEKFQLPRSWKSYKIRQYNGFLINFENVNSLAEFLKQRFGKTSRYKLRREQKKLEHCFDITYEMYFGDITDKTFDFLFKEFYRLLEMRSKEKGLKSNKYLTELHDSYDRVFEMIQSKQASFFVIYNCKQPIDICLNFHLKDTMFQHIRTYDIAYSKFNTGYIDLMKQIEWCIDNKIVSISFHKGDFYWKRRWCNKVFDYDYEVFYNARSLPALFSAFKFGLNRLIRQFLRDKGVMANYHIYRDKKRKSRSITLPIFPFKDIDESYNQADLEKIDYNDSKYHFLRRTIFEFLYAFNEKEEDTTLYALKNESESYLIKGKSKTVVFSALESKQP